MDWGLGNPNKTAALIATLMVAVWGLAYVKRWGFWLALTLSAALGVCLVQTFSRGGLVAALGGLAVVAYYAPCPWDRRRLAVCLIASAGLVIYGFQLKMGDRMAAGALAEDKSVTNRLLIWEVAPRMMVDAPWGWGLGNSGDAYMQWYQPIDNTEGYRTFVNSHLTWLVEFGWPLRLLYVMAWIGMILLCTPNDRARWRSVSLGVILAFCLAAFFSSVAENIWLWIVPLALTLAAIASRFWLHDWPKSRSWKWGITTVVVICMALFVEGKVTSTNLIHGANGWVIVGREKQPEFWIKVDTKVMGNNYGKAWRREKSVIINNQSVSFFESLSAVPKEKNVKLILSGKLTKEDLQALLTMADRIDQLILINPSFSPSEIGSLANSTTVVLGEFYQDHSVPKWRQLPSDRVKTLPGSAEYISSWAEEIIHLTKLNQGLEP